MELFRKPQEPWCSAMPQAKFQVMAIGGKTIGTASSGEAELCYESRKGEHSSGGGLSRRRD